MAAPPPNNEKTVFYTGKLHGLTGMQWLQGCLEVTWLVPSWCTFCGNHTSMQPFTVSLLFEAAYLHVSCQLPPAVLAE